MHVPAHEIRIAALEEENERLRQRIEALKSDDKREPLIFPTSWRLSPQERSVLSTLMSRDWASHRRICSLMPTTSEALAKIVHLHITRIRNKLAPFGITIETLYGDGYRIPPAAKDLIRRLSETAS